jgi:hypothetical protein
MKSEIYNALASLNRSFDVIRESIVILQQEGVVSTAYLQQQAEITEEVRAGINSVIHNKLQTRELEDREHYAKMRSATEIRLTELRSPAEDNPLAAARNEIEKYELKIVFSITSDQVAQSVRDRIVESARMVPSTHVTEHRLHKVTKL